MRDTMERIKKFLKASGGMGLRIVKTGIAAMAYGTESVPKVYKIFVLIVTLYCRIYLKM